MYGKTLADFPGRFDEFLEEFSTTDPAVLDVAFREARSTCKEFPTPADVRSQIREQVKLSDQFEAEKAWDLVQLVWRRHWHPDVGFHSNPPAFDNATEYALRQVGGMRRINEIELDHMTFLRRDFLAAHRRFHETGGFLAPSRSEATAMLENIQRGELGK